MPTIIYALKDYEPPAPPAPAPELKQADVDKVKARVRTLLADGPMEELKLVHHTTHEARHTDGIATITAAQVKQVIAEMGAGDEFKEGMGKVAVAVEPEPLPK